MCNSCRLGNQILGIETFALKQAFSSTFLASSMATRNSLARANLKTGRAWAMRLTFQDIYKEPNRRWAEVQFDLWCSWTRRSRL